MSRSTIINEMSQSVTGTFLLHDLLSISTKSGSVMITVIPQPATSSKVSAELRVHTLSGSIRVTMAPFLHDPSIQIPERIFNSSLKTVSGSISADLIHNHQTSLSSTSGATNTSLYPLRQPSSTSYLNVRNVSGSMSLALHPFVDDPRLGLKTLSADFSGVSGNLDLRFPCTWEGEINSRLGSGRVSHAWEGLQVLQDGPRFRARSGNGSGQLNIEGASMNVELATQKVPGWSNAGVRGDRVAAIPDMPGSRRDADLEKGEDDDDDDDWTIVRDEDGAEELTRRPPPSYEDLRPA